MCTSISIICSMLKGEFNIASNDFLLYIIRFVSAECRKNTCCSMIEECVIKQEIYIPFVGYALRHLFIPLLVFEIFESTGEMYILKFW